MSKGFVPAAPARSAKDHQRKNFILFVPTVVPRLTLVTGSAKNMRFLPKILVRPRINQKTKTEVCLALGKQSFGR
jgi:hypothetical protein